MDEKRPQVTSQITKERNFDSIFALIFTIIIKNILSINIIYKKYHVNLLQFKMNKNIMNLVEQTFD